MKQGWVKAHYSFWSLALADKPNEKINNQIRYLCGLSVTPCLFLSTHYLPLTNLLYNICPKMTSTYPSHPTRECERKMIKAKSYYAGKNTKLLRARSSHSPALKLFLSFLASAHHDIELSRRHPDGKNTRITNNDNIYQFDWIYTAIRQLE